MSTIQSVTDKQHMESGEPHHHVKFKLEEEEVKTHHENLEIEKEDENVFHINLGYLKINHYYRVAFDLDYETEALEYLVDKSSKYLTFKEMRRDKDNARTYFVFVFYAYKEKSEKENVYFRVKNGQPVDLQISFEAKVLGAHQGTPFLRNGIILMPHADHQANDKSHFNFI